MMRKVTTRRLQVMTGTIAIVLAFSTFACPTLAIATTDPSKWLLTFNVGRNVDKTKVEGGAPQEERNECAAPSKLSTDVCQVGEEGTGAREFSYDESVAASKFTGNVYVGDASAHRVQVLDSEGKFLFMFGWNVNQTKLALGAGATQAEKNVCTAASKEECGDGEKGTGLAGQISDAESVAVDPTTGNVYVLDTEYHRIDEYTASGEFVLMVGGEVNKKGGDICAKAEEAQCQEGVEGAGEGALEKLEATGYGNLMTVDSDGFLYVGDEARVQKFEADGAWVGQISVPGTVRGIAVDAVGDVFVTDSAAGGVHEYNAKDELQACVADPAGKNIRGLALDSAEHLGLTELTHAVVYDTQGASCGKLVGEIAPPSWAVTGLPMGIAFSQHENNKGEAEDLFYIANANDRAIEGYVPLLFPEVRTCATTKLSVTSVDLCGEVNPNGLLTQGFFEYGTEESKLIDKTGTAFTGEEASWQLMVDEPTDLVPNQTYFDRAWVEAESEGTKQMQPALEVVSFRTRAASPEVPGEPVASFITSQSSILNATVDPEHAITDYYFEYAQCENESQAFTECREPRSTTNLASEVYGAVGVAQEISGLAPQATYAYRLVAENGFEIEGKHEGGRTVGAEGHMKTSQLPIPSAVTGSASAVTVTGAIVTGLIDPDGPAATYVFELGLYTGASTQYGVVFSGPVSATLKPVEERLALSGLQSATTYAYRIAIKSGYVANQNGEAQGETRVFTTSGLPALLESPPALTILPIPTVKFPIEGKSQSKSAVKCKRGYERNKQGKCVKRVSRAKKTARSRRKSKR